MNTIEQNLNNAKKQIRALGVKVKVNVMECCRGCITDEKLGLTSSTQPYIFTYGGQGNAVSWVDGLPFLRSDAKKWRLSDKDMVNTEYFNHGNLTPELTYQIVEIFHNNGLAANWDGNEYRCIEVDFKSTLLQMEQVKAEEALQYDYAMC
jgi:hypothetical protein